MVGVFLCFFFLRNVRVVRTHFCAMRNFSKKTIILVWFNLVVLILTNSFMASWYQILMLNVIINIAKYFDNNSKKRNLSGDANPEEERKKIRDGSSACTRDNCDVFEEGLKSPECKEIFFNCQKSAGKGN